MCIRDSGWRAALVADHGLALGLNTFEGHVTYPSVAEAHGLEAWKLSDALS